MKNRPDPVVIRRESGGWLALSPPTAELRIGVVGASEAEARTRFIEAVEAWKLLAELPDVNMGAAA